MDSASTIQEIKDKIKKFAEVRDWDQFHEGKDLAIGVSTEAAELLEHFRFKSPEEVRALFMDPIKKEEISFEMADTLFFLLRMAERYGIDISDAFEKKMQRNEIRYPKDKSLGSNKKYDEL